MDIEEFRARGKEMVDYICEFMGNIHTRRVTPDIGPGYLRPLLPSGPPNDPESWDEIMKDVESKIMPGVSIRDIPEGISDIKFMSESFGELLQRSVSCD